MIDSVANTITDSPMLSFRGRILAYVELTKPRIAVMLVLTSAAGFYLGQTGDFAPVLFVNSLVGIALLAFGVATLNQWIERRTDLLMERTASRPLPSGKLAAYEALIFGIVLALGAEIYLYFLVNPLTAFLGLVVIVGYVLIYTPLKRYTPLSTAIGAVPGAMPPLMGWTSSANEITLGAWSIFAVLFLWQFPHFLAIAWMYKEQYAKAGILMLPVVEPSGRMTAFQIVLFTIVLVPVSLAPFFLGVGGPIFLSAAVVLGIWILYESVAAAREMTVNRARRLLIVSVSYLPLYFIILSLDH